MTEPDKKMESPLARLAGVLARHARFKNDTAALDDEERMLLDEIRKGQEREQ